MRQRFSPEQWAKWLDEFERSGLTVTEFCKRKRVCQNSFYQWRRKLSHTSKPDVFVPVAITGDEDVRIEMPCGAVIRLPNDPSVLRPVFQTLLQIGASPS